MKRIFEAAVTVTALLATVLLSGCNRCKSDIHELFREPYAVWGTPRLTLVDADHLGQPDDERYSMSDGNLTIVYYRDDQICPEYAYTFDAGYKLCRATLKVYASHAEICDFLRRRYYQYGNVDGYDLSYFGNASDGLRATLGVSIAYKGDEPYYSVVYTPGPAHTNN